MKILQQRTSINRTTTTAKRLGQQQSCSLLRHGVMPGHTVYTPRRSTHVHALTEDDTKQYGLDDVRLRVQRMGQKYDFLSAFMGSIAVTGYFVFARGQDVGLALSITSCSTVIAVLVNELLFDSGNSN